MTTIVPRPNRDALDKGLNIYRDAMRPFILRGLKRVRGLSVEDAMRRALGRGGYRWISAGLRKPGATVADFLDVNHFPIIVDHFWSEVFKREFYEDRTVRHRLEIIRNARNQVAHPDAKDLDIDIAAEALISISLVLSAINAPEEAAAVQAIRENLLQPAPPATVPSPTPPQPSPAPEPAVPTGTVGYCYVYTDLPTRTSRIHKSSCYYYKNRATSRRDDNWWHGPYDSLQQAKQNLDAQDKIRVCKVCNP